MFQDNKLKKSHGDDFDTDEECGDVLYWSFKALYEGIWPSRDHRGVGYDPDSPEGVLAGTDLAGGYFAVIWLN